MAPFWQFEAKWGHIALQGGQHGPILPPGRVAWPHFEMGAMLPSFTTSFNSVNLSLVFKVLPQIYMLYQSAVPQ